MNNIKQFIAVLFIALTFAGCNSGGKKKVLLKLNYPKGNRIDITYHTYITNKYNNSLKDESVRMMFKVDSIMNDSAYLLSAKFIRVTVNNFGLIKGEAYSSDKKEKDMTDEEKKLHQSFKPALDAFYTLTISKSGRIVKPFSFAGGRSIPQTYAPIDFENCQIVFPKDSIAIGDEWTNERIIPLTGAKRISSYKTFRIIDDTIEIAETGVLEMPNGGRSENFTGTYIIDADTKGLISANIELKKEPDLKVKIDIEAR